MRSNLRHSAPVLLILALVFPLGASMPLACCAGVVPGAHAGAAANPAPHCGGGEGAGESCCERAAEDAAARHCCAGGDAFERPQREPLPRLAEVPPGVTTPVLTAPTFLALAPAVRDPVPRFEPLYTLHSSLLI